MRISLALAAVLLSAGSVNAAQQQFNPPHLLIRTVCADSANCETINALVSRTVAYTGTNSVEGVLHVGESDPLEPCMQKLGVWKDTEVADCMKNHLAGNAPREALNAGKYDGYLVYVLRNGPNGSPFGRAVLLTFDGQRVDSYAAINEYDTAGQPLGNAKPAVDQRSLIVLFPELPDYAERAGLHGFPAHGPIAPADSGFGKGWAFGSVYVPAVRR